MSEAILELRDITKRFGGGTGKQARPSLILNPIPAL